MDKKKIVRYGTLALILFFAFEYLWPLLYAPAAQETASPSPSTIAVTGGGGNATARVASLENGIVLLCSNTQLDSLKSEVEQIPGVSRVIFGGSLLDVSFSNDTAVPPMLAALNSSCKTQAMALRKALLDFPNGLYVNTTAGRQFVPASNLKSIPGKVFASTTSNSTVKVCYLLDEKGFKILQETLDESICPTN
jgi:hypothetical protein